MPDYRAIKGSTKNRPHLAGLNKVLKKFVKVGIVGQGLVEEGVVLREVILWKHGH